MTAIIKASENTLLPALAPSQAKVYQQLLDLLAIMPAIVLMGSTGSGKTLVLQHLADAMGGTLISAETVVDACRSVSAQNWDEAVRLRIEQALEQYPVVVIDDYHYIASVSGRSDTRGGYFPMLAMRQLIAKAGRDNKRLVLAGSPPQAWESVGDVYGDFMAALSLPAFSPADYQAIARNLLGEARVAATDFQLVYRYAALLNGHQLRTLFNLHTLDNLELTGEQLIDTLSRYVLSSNTRVSEVEALTFDRLPGAEHIVEALETHIVLPLENRQLAMQLGLKPKRGVLLYGPPGTGKTSIGRALAHRMKGKFFLIDGSFVSEPPGNFFGKLQSVVNEAKENAPSVLFIDDADLLFKIDHIAGLERYLLTLLDGLESESASGVCVMMTAMNAALVPEALLRSGRVELWLQTHVPAAPIRARILERWVEGCGLPTSAPVMFQDLAETTEGFTPADLRRVVSDAKALYAMDIVKQRRELQAGTYLQNAIDEVIRLRGLMADSLGDDSLRVGGTGSYPVTDAGACGSDACGW
ncbi:AAA+-type ATPase, SpoVK/Ycf46/Vps4 family [Pseudomonas cuatrocienegasensis]|uniref:AAA+-type ATPase, SpoVK/Ycf46/Vps4 family n=1 Tax=Pseudomonas cuatrocienegasensis TaxID=543360 RepID=A0ABY1B9Y5_9PSED|nr:MULTISPECIES: ATP-binding protein [Pseudomonas]OEC35378.1 hypothetical protein A7D25_09685 [Pseudomonas sp. 21C1]SEQ34069.1 AAA+-type ATPase, SpoVK/Ycf46/Vps4 family [Pseudomonas cuatrocienegasensis]